MIETTCFFFPRWILFFLGPFKCHDFQVWSPWSFWMKSCRWEAKPCRWEKTLQELNGWTKKAFLATWNGGMKVPFFVFACFQDWARTFVPCHGGIQHVEVGVKSVPNLRPSLTTQTVCPELLDSNLWNQWCYSNSQELPDLIEYSEVNIFQPFY